MSKYEEDDYIPLSPEDIMGDGPKEPITYEGEIGVSGVPYHKTLEILDSSKVKAFMDCPRGFFFRHVLGWGQAEPRIHLVFGSAWHDAMEYLLHNGYDSESIYYAYEKFMKVWNTAYTEHVPEPNSGKNPSNALKALVEYAERWRQEDQDIKVLVTETAGAIPISEDRMFYIKLDSALYKPSGSNKGIWSREHKTTGRDTTVWADGWMTDIQVGVYGHGLHFIAPVYGFSSDDVRGIEINGAILRKGNKNGENGNKFVRIPIEASGRQNLQWLWELNHWIDLIEWNMAELAESKPSDAVMYSFPRNGVSCGKFGCRFKGLCSAWPNPLQHCHTPPPGYVIDFWDPRRIVEESANELIVDPSTEKASVVHKGRKEGIIRTIHD